jgi:hypothetical protein
MKTNTLSLFGCLLSLVVAVPALAAPKTFQERLALIKGDPKSPFGASGVGALEEQEGRKLTVEERAAFEMPDTGVWKVFEDEVLRFEHPDHPLFTATVLDEKKPGRIQVVGGVASMADNSFERAYHLKVGDLYYGVIFVREADWFDEGICMCGSIAFKKCALEDGTAIEFSLLDSGAVKKVQALGEKHRAILFEWTHSVVPQSAYARLGASLRFKMKSSRTLAQWHAFSEEKRGIDGLASWLERGSSTAEVKALLGEPTRVDGETLEYVTEEWRKDGAGFQTTLRVNLKGGTFDRFQDDWQAWKELPPKAGSIAWADQRLEYWDSDKATEKEKKTSMPGELKTITELFLANAGTAKGDDWDSWTSIAASVADRGVLDSKVMELVVKRFDEPGLSQRFGAKILVSYEYPNRKQLLLKEMERLLHGPVDDLAEFELDYLCDHVDQESPQFATLIKEACSHSYSGFRVEGFRHANFLPNSEAVNILRKGLDDEEYDARQAAAAKLDWVVSKADLGWLKQRLETEKDNQIKEELKDAIEAAEKSNE